MECLGITRQVMSANIALTLRDLLRNEPGMMIQTDIIGANADNTVQNLAGRPYLLATKTVFSNRSIKNPEQN